MTVSFAPLNTDGYKTFHKDAYAEGITQVYSNFTSRNGRLSNIPDEQSDGKVVFVGLQYFIKDELQKTWNDTFFHQPKDVAVNYIQRHLTAYLGKAYDVSNFEALHDLGYLPIEIKALPEGVSVPYGVPPVTFRNTHPDFAWLTNYLETIFSTQNWPIQTSATTAKQYLRNITNSFKRTGGDMNMLPFMCHDFSFRGMFGKEAAMMSGFGHLAAGNCGTDTIPAIIFAEEYYNANVENELVGVSVPATEHSTTTSYIMGMVEREGISKLEAEVKYVGYLFDKVPSGVLSHVSDSFDFFKFVTEGLPLLKDKILERDGTFVIRPDCYDSDTQILTDSGFKFFTELKEDDLVAAVQDDGSYIFEKPLKYVNQHYKGIMYKFKDHHGKVDLVVTPNHRMILERNGKEDVILAEDMLTKGNHTLKMSRSARQGNYLHKLSDYERLAIAFQADGSYQTGTNKIRFSFSKQRKMDRLEELLDRQEINFSKYYLDDGRVEYSVDAPATDFVKDFSWVDLPNIDFSYAKDFIEELSYWDAHRRSDDRFKFDTTNKNVSDTVELIAVAAGYGVYTSVYEDNRSGLFSDVYTSHIVKNNKVGGQSWVKEELNYDGTVHCVQVSSGKLIVKRNQSILVCGNSGDPVDILCGTNSNPTKIHTKEVKTVDKNPEYFGLIEILWNLFGGTVTEQGYKLLDPHIGAIYGDSITLERQDEIIKRLEAKGFVPNVVLGVGSYSYQYVTRDTHGSAVKATSVVWDGDQVDVCKDPATDSKKKSAKGLLRVELENGEYVLYDQQTPEQEEQGELKTAFKDGILRVEHSLEDIRQRVKESL